MANKDAVGRIGTPYEVELERGKIMEFAAATHSKNAAYWQDPNPVVPPTFLTTQMFWQEWGQRLGSADPNPWHYVELNQQRGMHAEQEFVFHGPPPRAGTKLTAQSRITDVFDKEGRKGGTMTFAVMVTEFRDETGRLVAESILTGVETARPPGEVS